MKIKKYLKIIWLFSKINLQKQLSYRPSFILAIVGKSLRMSILILMFKFIYFNTPLLAGWRFEEVYLLAVIFLTVESLMIATFHRNLSYYLPDLIKKGEFDFLLVKPLNPLFYTSFRVIDFFDLTSSLLIIYLWYYYFVHYAPAISFLTILIFIVFIIFALVFLFSLLVIIASSAFWTINATGLGRFFEESIRMGRFPTDIFKGFFSFLFLYLFPIGLVATTPAKIILGKSHWFYLFYLIIFTLVLFKISLKVWQKALKHYSSASS